MVGPEMFVDLRVQVAVDASDDKGKNEDDVAVDPDVVGEIVVVAPVDVLEHVVNIKCYKYHCIFKRYRKT